MKLAILTGTSRGLGRALALKLLECGWTVHGLARENSDINHPRFHSHAIDITHEPSVQSTIAKIGESSQGLDLLINNAGSASMNALLLTPGSVAESLMRTNYLGAFYCLQAAGKSMVRQRKGLIINITTVAVPLALAGEAAYVASKAALDALTKVAATELLPHGIKVVGLGLGPIDTRLTRAVSQNKLTEINQRIKRPQGTTLDEATAFILEKINDPQLASGQIYYLGQVT